MSSQCAKALADGPLVDFDIDSGPVVNGIFPPLFLLPEESENMSAWIFLLFYDSLNSVQRIFIVS